MTAGRSVPLVVVEGSERSLEVAWRELERAGWAICRGWHHRGSGVVVAGVVTDEHEAADALLAAIDGAGLLVHALADRPLVDRLCDDLRRLGRVDHRVDEPPDAEVLTGEQAELVDLLAAGMRLGEVAAALHISRRTADRRLAAARAAYGAPTTTALLAEHARRRR